MRKPVGLVLIIVGVALASGVTGWLIARSSQKPTSPPTVQLQETAKKNEVLRQEVARLTRTVKQLKGDPVVSTKPTVSASSSSSPADGQGALNDLKSGTDAAKEKKGGVGDLVNQMMADPRMQEMIQAQQKAIIEKMYGPFFKELGLKPEEIEAVMNALMESQSRGMKNGLALLNGTEEEKKKMAQELADQHRQDEEKIKQLLGEERYSKYQEYQKSLPSRMAVDQFKQELGSRNLALNEPQEKQLLQVIQEEDRKGMENISGSTPSTPPSSPEAVKALMDKRHETYQRIVERTNSFLSPEQVSALASFYERQVNMEEMGMQFMGKMMETPKPSAPTR